MRRDYLLKPMMSIGATNDAHNYGSGCHGSGTAHEPPASHRLRVQSGGMTMATNGKASDGDTLRLTQRLNARRRELIRPVLGEPRRFVLLGLRGTARKLGSDPATLLRTVQAMGFKRYRDFQQYLHDRSIAFSTSLDAWLEHEPAAGTPRLVRASIERDIQNLQQLRSGLNAERLIALARRLYQARRILLLAGDVVTCVAHYLQY